MTRTSKLFTLILLLAAVLAAGCGGGKKVIQCSDNTSCPADQPICKADSKGQKTCMPPSGQADCTQLEPANNSMCVHYSFEAGKCKKTEGKKDGDQCCPAGLYSTDDSDCPVICTGNSSCDPATPVCKDDGTGHNICQKASSQADCDALDTTGDSCSKLKWNSATSTCIKVLTKPNKLAADQCCPAGLFRDQDADCPLKCITNITCQSDGDNSICKDNGSGQKVCQKPKTQADCDSLIVSSDLSCTKYELQGDKCVNIGGANLTTSDACCPAGHYSDTDIDCPVKCNDSGDCAQFPDKKVCKEDPADSNVKICSVPSQQADCGELEKITTSLVGTCKHLEFDNGQACIETGGADPISSDNCCPSDKLTYSDEDIDCPTLCKDDNDCVGQPDGMTTCKEDPKGPAGSAKKICQVPTGQADCNTKSTPTPTNNCSRYTFQAASGSDPAECVEETGESGTKTDSCCPTGGIKPEDVDCVDECRTGADCNDTSKPICGDVSGHKKCVAATTQDECNQIHGITKSSPKNSKGKFVDATCHYYDLSGNQCVEGGGADTTTSDACCPDGLYQDQDIDCPKKCTDSSECSGTTPICLPDAKGQKVCKAAADQGACNTLIPKDNSNCENYTYQSDGSCQKGKFTKTLDGDKCCPVGFYHDSDKDCPVGKPSYDAKVGGKCQQVSQTNDCGKEGKCIEETKDSKNNTLYKDGMCTVEWSVACGQGTKDCPAGSVCVQDDGYTRCMPSCNDVGKKSGCRDGYICSLDPTGTKSYCAPLKKIEIKNLAGPCSSSLQCGNDPLAVCITPQKDDTWRGGYCSGDCTGSDELCPEHTRCVSVPGITGKRCLRACDTNSLGNSVNKFKYKWRGEYYCDDDKQVFTSKRPFAFGCSTNFGTVGGTEFVYGYLLCQYNNDASSSYVYTCQEKGRLGVSSYGYCVATTKSDSGVCPEGTAKYPGTNDCYKKCSVVTTTVSSECNFVDVKTKCSDTGKKDANSKSILLCYNNVSGKIDTSTVTKKYSGMGGPCNSDAACKIGSSNAALMKCLTGPNYPNGYCSYDLLNNPGNYKDNLNHSVCPGTKTKDVIPTNTAWASEFGGNGQYCLKRCSTDKDCERKIENCGTGSNCTNRDYVCASDGFAGNFCIYRKVRDKHPSGPATKKGIAEHCLNDGECQSGLICLLQSKSKIRDSVCTKPCTNDDECSTLPAGVDPDDYVHPYTCHELPADGSDPSHKKYCMQGCFAATTEDASLNRTCDNPNLTCGADRWCW